MKKFPSDKTNVTKNALFFLSRTLTHHSYTFTLLFLYELKHMVYLSLTVCRISDFVSFLLNLSFCSTKSMDSLTLKRHNSFRNKNNRKATHSLARRPMNFKLQQEVWKFYDIYVSWNSPKTALEMNFLKLENRRFVYFPFSQ